MRRHFSAAFIATALIISFGILSCSGAVSLPTSPELSQQSTNNLSTASASTKMLWGFWDISIDPSTGQVEIIPLRNVEFKANVTMFMQPPAGNIANLGIHIVDLSNFYTDGLIDVNVTLRHPFPGLDMYTGFDVLGVFVHDGDTYSKYNNSIFFARTDETALLLNPDGYTRWFNPTEFPMSGILGFTEGKLGNKGITFTGSINPFMYFCDGLESEDALVDYLHDPGNIDNRGMFQAGSANSRLYRLKFPFLGAEPSLTFQYAVVASWEPSQPSPPMEIPDDFPISANQREPFCLSFEDNGSTLFYDNGTGGGTLKIRTELFDWAAKDNPDGILGEFSKIVIESSNADVYGDYMEFYPEDFEPYIADGTAVSSVAELELDGVTPVSQDDVEFLVTVESVAGDTYNQGFPQPAPDEQLASYFRFTIPIGNNPCANFTVTGAEPSPGGSGMFYEGFLVYGTNFQDGPNLAVDIVAGVDVLASAENVVYSDSTTITCDFDLCGVNPGIYDLRVTNGCDPVSYGTMQYVIEPDPLKNIVLRDGAPIADLGICQFNGEPYIQFVDGQLWIYEPDYSSGTYMNSYPGLNRIEAQNPVDSIPAEATLGHTTSSGQFIYDHDENYYYNAGYSGNMIDVLAIYDNTRHYYCQNNGTFMLMSRRSINSHGGNISSYSGVGAGAGLVNMAASVGAECSSNLPENDSSWFYFLEGAPDYSVERLDYHGSSGYDHSFTSSGSFLSGPGDGNTQINNPKDISCDSDSRVYILDELSSGEPVVKVYTSDLVYVGSFGDSVSISGDPLRIDCDEGDGEVHVLHTNGISVFRLCEMPF